MGPCDIIEGDKWFGYKASEYRGSYKEWDELVDTVLRWLPMMPRELGNSLPEDPDVYFMGLSVIPPLVLI